jgi:hypothetical protein
MTRTLAVVLIVAIMAVGGCASAPPPQPRSAGPVQHLQRVAIVTSGESKFTVATDGTGQAEMPVDGVMADLARWLPGWYGAIVVPLARIVRAVVRTLGDDSLTTSTASRIGQVSPRAIVADAFARRLAESRQFLEVRTMERELVGDERRGVDAVVRVSVPTWGILRVREATPDLLSGFADVRAQIVVPTTGTVLWEYAEDVTHPDRRPLGAFTGESDVARSERVEVLERAGQRLATEFLYARGLAR